MFDETKHSKKHDKRHESKADSKSTSKAALMEESFLTGVDLDDIVPRDSNAKFSDVGKFLRTKREQLDVTIDLVATYLRLRPEYIDMIESGEYEEVSQKIYYFGAVGAMLRYYGLPSEKILDFLLDDSSVVSNIVKTAPSSEKGNQFQGAIDELLASKKSGKSMNGGNANKSGSKMILVIVVAAIALLGAAGIFNSLSSSSNQNDISIRL